MRGRCSPWPDGRAAGDTPLRIHEIGSGIANGSLRSIQLPADHNRLEVLARPNAVAASGDVLVSRIESSEGIRSCEALAATLAYAALGAVAVIQCAPGSQVNFAIQNYGAGQIDVIATSWAEW
jgi:hypothetical protein